MEIDLALLADAATVDASGKLNVLGVFDRITVPEFPARHGRMCLVLRFTAGVDEVGQHKLSITLRDPKGGEVVRAEAGFQLGASSAAVTEGIRVPQVLNLENVVYPTAGQYSVDVEIDGTLHVSVPLRIVGGAGAQA